MTNTTRPYWVPRGTSRAVMLTHGQLDYIRPVFNTCRGGNPGHSIDGVTLCGGRVSGHRLAFVDFLRRFEFSDIDVSNLVEASQP